LTPESEMNRRYQRHRRWCAKDAISLVIFKAPLSGYRVPSGCGVGEGGVRVWGGFARSAG